MIPAYYPEPLFPYRVPRIVLGVFVWHMLGELQAPHVERNAAMWHAALRASPAETLRFLDGLRGDAGRDLFESLADTIGHIRSDDGGKTWN
jgi:hypothetical protein